MSSSPLSLFSPARGMFQSDRVTQFTTDSRDSGLSFVHSATNIAIEEYQCRTRGAWHERALISAPDGWAEANFQSAVAYNPRSGKTSTSPGSGNSGIIENAGGRVYRYNLSEKSYSVEEISGGIRMRTNARIVTSIQAGNYVISTERGSNTSIWDGAATTRTTGYNPSAIASSRLPNFAGPLAYTNRIFVANAGVEVIASDNDHASDLTGHTDLLKTSQQATDILSQTFSAPGSMGEVTGAWVVNSYRGGNISAQADIYFSTESGGLWAVLGGQPRSTWSTTAMVRIISQDSGPCGPFAAWAGVDELIFRSSRGVASIKTLSRETSQVGNPRVDLGSEIQPLLSRDPQDLLQFACVMKVTNEDRIFVTVYPKVSGPHRWHRGYVSLSLAPGRTRNPESSLWEAVQVLPKAMGDPMQFIELRELGRIRTFAILRKKDGGKSLAEYSGNWGDDILADGTTAPIPWQLLTRRLTRRSEFGKNGWSEAFLSLLEIRETVNVTISARDSVGTDYIQVYAGQFTNSTWAAGCAQEPRGYMNADIISLGSIFKRFTGPWLEILVQGTGSAVIDLAMQSGEGGMVATTPTPNKVCAEGALVCNKFDIFRRA